MVTITGEWAPEPRAPAARPVWHTWGADGSHTPTGCSDCSGQKMSKMCYIKLYTSSLYILYIYIIYIIYIYIIYYIYIYIYIYIYYIYIYHHYIYVVVPFVFKLDPSRSVKASRHPNVTGCPHSSRSSSLVCSLPSTARLLDMLICLSSNGLV